MEKKELEAALRQGDKKSDKSSVRASGLIPAIVYGKGFRNIVVSVDSKKLQKMIGGPAGVNVIISLKIAEGDKHKTVPVLTHEIQRNPLTDAILHVDFIHVKMEEKLKAKVQIVLFGDPVGVKEHGGILVHGLRQIEVKCLPAEIPDKFELDVSSLKIGETLHVSDLVAPKGVEILTPQTETLVHISAPAKEEELAPTPEISAAEVPSEKGAPKPEEAAVPAEGKKAEKGAKPEEKKAAAPEAAKAAAPAQPKGAAPAAKPETKK